MDQAEFLKRPQAGGLPPRSASASPDPLFAGRIAALGTMHGKASVVGPLLVEALGLRVEVPAGLDTDRLGTFSGEVPRAGSQLEAARAKAELAMALTGADIGLGSEGSFGPHPAVPFVAANRELLVLVDRQHGFEIVGSVLTTATNHSFAIVASAPEALGFAKRAGFPSHALIVRDGPDPQGSRVVAKGIVTPAALTAIVEDALARAPARAVTVEADMRAHLNPRRMLAIAEATRELIRLVLARCPSCACPGFDLIEVEAGLACGWCGRPTREALAYILGCQRCDLKERQPFPAGAKVADPGRCDACNP